MADDLSFQQEIFIEKSLLILKAYLVSKGIFHLFIYFLILILQHLNVVHRRKSQSYRQEVFINYFTCFFLFSIINLSTE